MSVIEMVFVANGVIVLLVMLAYIAQYTFRTKWNIYKREIRRSKGVKKDVKN